jgi:hypothetical protein
MGIPRLQECYRIHPIGDKAMPMVQQENVSTVVPSIRTPRLGWHCRFVVRIQDQAYDGQMQA